MVFLKMIFLRTMNKNSKRAYGTVCTICRNNGEQIWEI